jgi:hypothetical protein
MKIGREGLPFGKREAEQWGLHIEEYLEHQKGLG